VHFAIDRLGRTGDVRIEAKRELRDRARAREQHAVVGTLHTNGRAAPERHVGAGAPIHGRVRRGQHQLALGSGEGSRKEHRNQRESDHGKGVIDAQSGLA
jgi:hypothetical protein